MSHLGQIESDAGVGIPAVVEAPAVSADVMENVGGGVNVTHNAVAAAAGPEVNIDFSWAAPRNPYTYAATRAAMRRGGPRN